MRKLFYVVLFVSCFTTGLLSAKLQTKSVEYVQAGATLGVEQFDGCRELGQEVVIPNSNEKYILVGCSLKANDDWLSEK